MKKFKEAYSKKELLKILRKNKINLDLFEFAFVSSCDYGDKFCVGCVEDCIEIIHAIKIETLEEITRIIEKKIKFWSREKPDKIVIVPYELKNLSTENLFKYVQTMIVDVLKNLREELGELK